MPHPLGGSRLRQQARFEANRREAAALGPRWEPPGGIIKGKALEPFFPPFLSVQKGGPRRIGAG